MTRSLERALRQSPVLRRFAGFAAADPTPDHSSFSRFHSALAARGLDAALFAELERQLDALGLFRKRATLLDATLLEAQLRRPPYSAGRAAKHPLDPDADWSFSGRGRRSHFGYKAHLGLDLGSLLIRRAELSSAKVYESELAERLICADAGAVYADKAYESKARRAALRRRGIKPRIMHRAHKHQPQLPHWQQVHNRLIGQVRRQVECSFGILKQHYRYRRVGHRAPPPAHAHRRPLETPAGGRSAPSAPRLHTPAASAPRTAPTPADDFCNSLLGAGISWRTSGAPR